MIEEWTFNDHDVTPDLAEPKQALIIFFTLCVQYLFALFKRTAHI